MNKKKIIFILFCFFTFFISITTVHAEEKRVYWDTHSNETAGGVSYSIATYLERKYDFNASVVEEIIFNDSDRTGETFDDYPNIINGRTIKVKLIANKLYIIFSGTLYFCSKPVGLFSGFKNVKKISGFEYVSTSNITDMTNLFYGCNSLEYLDLSSFDTSNVTSMNEMFYHCYALKELNVSNFNTENVTDMYRMFSGCKSLVDLDLSSFSTPNVITMGGMFSGCLNLEEVDLSNFVASYHGINSGTSTTFVNINDMFKDCGKLLKVDFSKFNYSEDRAHPGYVTGFMSENGDVIADSHSFNAGVYYAVFTIKGLINEDTDKSVIMGKIPYGRALILPTSKSSSVLASNENYPDKYKKGYCIDGWYRTRTLNPDTNEYEYSDLIEGSIRLDKDFEYSIYRDTYGGVERIIRDRTITLYPKFALRSYNVTFVDDDGTVLKESTEYVYGTKKENIVSPRIPVKPKTAKYNYAFSGWSPEITDVTEDVTYKATYNEALNKYTVTWKDSVGNYVLETDNDVSYGSHIEYNGPKLGTESSKFIGWVKNQSDSNAEIVNLDDIMVEGDLVLYARYEYLLLQSDVESVDYDTTYVNFKDTIVKNVIIKNAGKEKLRISIKSPTNSGPFGILSFEEEKELNANEECEIKLIVDPNGTNHDVAGTYNGTYEIIGTSDRGNTISLKINAKIILKNPELLEYLPLSTDVDSVDFGITNINFKNSIIKKVKIKNSSNRIVAISIKSPDKVGPFSYHALSEGISLGPNEEREVEFLAVTGGTNSKIPGTYSGKYEITGTSEYGETATIKISAKIVLKDASVEYTTHVQSYGWQDYVKDGEMSGTQGEAKRLEAIKIKLEYMPYEGNIEYRTHIQSYGWETEFKKNDEMSGTSGEAKRLEAIEIKLTGEMAKHYDVYYRVHAQKFGWLGWARNGESAGTSGYAYRLEGIEIKLVAKGKTFKEYGKKYTFVDKETGKKTPVSDTSLVAYTTHVQSYGWQDYVRDGAMSGTSGEAKRLEAIKIKLEHQKYSGGIEYQTHVQSYGWQDYVSDDAMSGTSGEAKRLEAIKIRLTGEMAKHYDVYYRVHAQSFGWLGWAKNGEESGTAGLAKRLEGIEIILVSKGEQPPTRDNQNDSRPFIQG